eukprot:4525240-Pleurochrysis_carterae.AAC.1
MSSTRRNKNQREICEQRARFWDLGLELDASERLAMVKVCEVHLLAHEHLLKQKTRRLRANCKSEDQHAKVSACKTKRWSVDSTN